MFRKFLIGMVLPLCIACQPGPLKLAQVANAADSSAGAPAHLAREENIETELYDFEYSYPAEAGAIAGLKALLDARLTGAREDLEVNTREARNEAQAGGYPYRQHASMTNWHTVAELPGWLSLSAEVYSYSGGAHGMTVFDTLLWDRVAGEARDPLALFTSAHALSEAIASPFCEALNAKRSERRGQPTREGSDDPFDACIDPLRGVLVLGSSNGHHFDRLHLLVPPYEAGPYAEGTYNITIPVSQAVIATVRPAFQSDFAPGG